MSTASIIDPGLRAKQLAAQHGVDFSKLPKTMDLSVDSLTSKMHGMDLSSADERTKFIYARLVDHLYAFIRETSITTEEWMSALQFLEKTGKFSTDIRPEFILLSDVLGVSTLVNSINNAKPPGATEATLLGPFFREDAEYVPNGESIASEGKGDYMFVEGRVLDTHGNPIAGAIIDTWESDDTGHYDSQYDNPDKTDCRGRLMSAEDGSYSFRAVVPTPYPIPSDGTVGSLLKRLGRHTYRPAHLHIVIQASGFEKLITSLFFEDDPYLTSDVVFAVRSSLIVKPEIVTDEDKTVARGFPQRKPHVYVKKDFILAMPEEGAEARKAFLKGRSV